jgi:hypothetical protein
MIRRFLSRQTDVTARAPTGGDLLAWSATLNRWVNTAALAIYGTQAANTVLAGPASGGAANPTFRALGIADLSPVVSTCYITGTVSQATNPAAWGDVTGLSFAVLNAATYAFEFELATVASATTNFGLYGVNGPTNSLLVVNVSRAGNTAGTGGAFSSVTAYNTGNAPASVNSSGALPVRISGIITTTASGTLIVRQKNTTNSAAVTVNAGSWGRLTRLA